jgi:uncharacterized protein (DUF2235 family)
MQNCEFFIATTFCNVTNAAAKDTAGDRICLFGFSRGGYTARALAGMIHKVGILPAGNYRQVHVAFNYFCRGDNPGWDKADWPKEFKKSFCNDAAIEFLGVWYVWPLR